MSMYFKRPKLKFSTLGIAAALAVMAISQEASAIPLTLTEAVGHTVGPQSTSNPCIIAGTHCSNPDFFGYNNFQQSGNQTDLNAYSTTPTAELPDGTQGTPYNGALFVAPFLVAIDVNTTQAQGETLELFEVIVNGVVLYSYAPPIAPTLIGTGPDNGNGYADWTLGTIDLTSLGVNDTVLFHAVVSGLSDGAESFFLVRADGCTGPDCPVVNPQCSVTAPCETPEPGSLALLGTGLIGMVGGVLWWRRRNEDEKNTRWHRKPL